MREELEILKDGSYGIYYRSVRQYFDQALIEQEAHLLKRKAEERRDSLLPTPLERSRESMEAQLAARNMSLQWQTEADAVSEGQESDEDRNDIISIPDSPETVGGPYPYTGPSLTNPSEPVDNQIPMDLTTPRSSRSFPPRQVSLNLNKNNENFPPLPEASSPPVGQTPPVTSTPFFPRSQNERHLRSEGRELIDADIPIPEQIPNSKEDATTVVSTEPLPDGIRQDVEETGFEASRSTSTSKGGVTSETLPEPTADNTCQDGEGVEEETGNQILNSKGGTARAVSSEPLPDGIRQDVEETESEPHPQTLTSKGGVTTETLPEPTSGPQGQGDEEIRAE